jgi:hypothetical protein
MCVCVREGYVPATLTPMTMSFCAVLMVMGEARSVLAGDDVTLAWW